MNVKRIFIGILIIAVCSFINVARINADTLKLRSIDESRICESACYENNSSLENDRKNTAEKSKSSITWGLGAFAGYGWLGNLKEIEDPLRSNYEFDEIDFDMVLGFWAKVQVGANSFALELPEFGISNTFFDNTGPPREGISIDYNSVGIQYSRLIPHGSILDKLNIYPAVAVNYIWATLVAGTDPLGSNKQKVLSGNGLGYSAGVKFQFKIPVEDNLSFDIALEYRYRFWNITDTETHSGAILSFSEGTPMDLSGHIVMLVLGGSVE